jgi:predicted regulator of Ras-like GTPase activity (Roadblock/LC7/MglB family)
MVSDNSEKMRQTRLAFYQEEVGTITKILEQFVEKSQAKAVFLIDREGHLVTTAGFTKGYDTTSVSALVAGSFASTKALAEKLGEPRFTMLFHEGENENLHVSLVSDRALLVIIFDDRTTVGMIRLFSSQVVEQIAKVLNESEEKRKDDPAPAVSAEFAGEAQSAIDDFFGSVDKKE